MRNLTLLLAFTFLLTACKEEKKEQNSAREVETETIDTAKKEFKRTQNYAVVFNWATQDEKLVMESSMPQADQLREMWNNGLVENIYYDAKAEYDKLSYFPNITFTLKAENQEEANNILDGLIVVQKGIATYKL